MLTKTFAIAKREECPEVASDDLNAQMPDCSLYEVRSNMQIEDAIRKLPEMYQMVIRLHDFEKLSYSKMVQLLGKSEGTIKCLVHRGRKLLQWFLECEAEMQGSIKQPEGQRDHIRVFAEMAVRIEKLPKPYRTILRLHYLEGRSYSEMAQLLGRPKGTVKSLVNRGKKILFEE